jgi:Asp-tRNA(Asn)/Glu-tRNA(Gln) amidotransferase A subunit family amidase
MTYRVEIARNAEVDLDELYRWVVARAPQQGAKWFNGLERAVLSLDHHPNRCPVAPESIDPDHPVVHQVDVLLTPTTPVPPPETSALPTAFDDIMTNDGVLWRNTRPFNFLAFPTISVPCGFTRSGLPIGLQLSGAPWQETELLRIAHTYEQASQWRVRRGRLARVGG